MNHTKVYWSTSKWKQEELQDKSVEFRIPLKDGFLTGNGTFLVAKNPEGQLFVQIVVTEQGRDWAEFVVRHFQAPQWAVDRIQKHPDPSVADFQLK
jgi:hypothetical protein